MAATVLGIFSHPDDAEFLCTGTLALLKNAGCTIHVVTLAPGDKGTAIHSSEKISRIRKKEGADAARLLGAEYHCLDFEDVYIVYDRDSINKTTAIIRKIRPDIVITASPNDYMIDHEITSMLVQTACFATGIKNMEIPEKHFEPVPYLYYSDPMEGKDKFGNPVIPGLYIDIRSEIELKEKILACHDSQRNWLLTHHKMDEYILSMKRFGEQRGQEINRNYAEGFRQHLGHGFPQKNILKELLGDHCIVNL
ncbi:MAG TPA: PIG-L family deacetylase [Bacteroides sp.]|nr:PIG-L family deacetylase [Bacteroides sp.]